jgi:hypothetical protein
VCSADRDRSRARARATPGRRARAPAQRAAVASAPTSLTSVTICALNSGVRVVGRPPSRRTPRPPLPSPGCSGSSATAASLGSWPTYQDPASSAPAVGASACTPCWPAPRPARDRAQDGLMEGPEVLAQQAVAEPDGIADDAVEGSRVVRLCQRVRHLPLPPGRTRATGAARRPCRPLPRPGWASRSRRDGRNRSPRHDLRYARSCYRGVYEPRATTGKLLQTSCARTSIGP